MLAMFTLLSQSFLFGPSSPLSDRVCSGSIYRVCDDGKKPGISHPGNDGHRWWVREFLGVIQPNSSFFSASGRGGKLVVSDPELLFMCLQ